MKYFIGIDIGTYETKGTLTDDQGNVVKTEKRRHGIIIPQPGFAEHDPNLWWSECCSIIRAFLETDGVNSADVAGICCSAVACGLVAVDENNAPVRNAILYGIDTRSIPEIAQLNERIGEERIMDFCAEALSVESFGPKILWIKNHEPELFKKVKQFTFVQGFINLQLTGNNCLDKYSVVFGLPMYNYRTQDWDDEMCAYVVPREMLPRLHDSKDVIGYVTKEAAAQTGLQEGTPVICGATDAGSEALSAGVAETGDTMVMYGSTIFIVHISEKLYVEGNPLWKASYLLPDTFAVLSGMATAGSLTHWLLNVMGQDMLTRSQDTGENEFDILFSGIDSVPPGSDGLMVLPYFAGERMPIKDPEAKGLMIGLTLSHTRNHIIRACIEGIGYALAQNLNIIQGMGLEIKEITAIGGGTKNPPWMRIMSDITGIPHKIYKQNMGASYGDAMLAALGTGNASVADIKKWNSVLEVIEPNMENHKFYSDHMRFFEELYTNNKDAMHRKWS